MTWNIKTDEWDLEEMFKMQAALDGRILRDRGLTHAEIAEELKIALLVEIHETLNEWKGFKYWKKDIKIDRDKLLEETVDVLHFLLSFGNLYNVPTTHFYTDKGKDILKTSKTLISTVLMMDGGILWMCAFAYFRGMAQQFGFSQIELELAYRAKNEKNHIRQDQNY